ncbi:MAG TPA: hypothetical protein VHP33_16825 [Polyangiaceae bacterium]|nr:hypothetical protein [Polyangiaceae bacterium]
MRTRAQPHKSRPGRLLWALAVSALALGCKGSDDKPAEQPPTESAGAGGAPDGGPAGQPPGGAAGANTPGGAGTAPVGEGGELNLPGAGGGPTEPGAWDQSFWDDAVWQ